MPLVLILSFQNCSSEVPFASPDGGPLEQFVNAGFFPYDANFDQIAYMSCSEQENVAQDPQTYFTFRVGAYRTTGLSLVDEFFEFTKRFTNEEKVNMLSRQLLSSGTNLQFALRSTGNFQQVFINEDSGASGLENYDYDNVFTSLGDEEFTPYLLQVPQGAVMNTWAGAAFDWQYRLEGNINFMASERMQNELRTFLSTGGMLALTFSESDSTVARGPGYLIGDTRDLGKNIFGTAVQIKFKTPSPDKFLPREGLPLNIYAGLTASIDMPPRLLASIDEVVIDGRKRGQPPGRWDCPEDLAFRIVLPANAVAQNCRMEPDPINPPPRLREIRQSLYVEDWHVDIQNRCVVPKADRVKTGSCYGINSNLQQTHIIQYDMTQPCGLATGNGVCPHFVSICIRQ